MKKIEDYFQPLYSRQQLVTSLRNLSKFSNVVIIGCGGIGSHVALRLAMMGVKNMTLIDDDRVEFHNLSRTYFTSENIGENKGVALGNFINKFREFQPLTMIDGIYYDIINNNVDEFNADEIEEFDDEFIISLAEAIDNESINVSVLPGKIQNYDLHHFRKKYGDELLIIDCTDRYFNPDDPELMSVGLEEVDWKLNYDNLDVTMTSKPYARNEDFSFKLPIAELSALGAGYTTVPSFFLTPDIIVSMFLMYISMVEYRSEKSFQYHINLGQFTSEVFSSEHLISFDKDLKVENNKEIDFENLEIINTEE